MEKQKNCEKCEALFNYFFNETGGYPDKRKYCDSCSAQRKADWEAKQNAPNNANLQTQIAPKTPNQAIANAPVSGVQNHDMVMRKDKPHSYEFGKVGNRHKIYYNDVLGLREHIQLLKNAESVELVVDEMAEFKPTE